MTGCPHRIPRPWTVVFAACAALGAAHLPATPAAAQHDGSTAPTERRGPQSFQGGMPYRGDLRYPGTALLLLDVAYHARSVGEVGSLMILAPVVEAGWAPSSSYELSFFLPFAQTWVDTPSTSIADADVGNVTVGVDYTARSGEATETRVGLRVATPTAQVDDEEPSDLVTAQFLFDQVAATSGFRRLWLWAPEQLGLVVPGRIVHRPIEELRLALSGAGAILLPVGDREGVETAAELFAEVAWESAHMAAGVRGGAALLPGRTDDSLQASIEPFVEFWLDELMLGLAFTMNLDGPAGFAFDEDGVFALHFNAGVRVGEHDTPDEPNASAR